MIIEEHIFGEIQHYVPGENGAAGSWVTYENGVLSDANVISASTKRLCCEDGKFTVGGVFAASLQLKCRLPGMSRYQLGNARIVLKSQYAGEAEPQPVGTFWAIKVGRVRDIFTIQGLDAMGWADVLAPIFSVTKQHTGGLTYTLSCIFDLMFWSETSDDQFVGRSIQSLLDRLAGVINPFLQDKTGIPDLLSVESYSFSDNCGVCYSNYYWTDPDVFWQEDPSQTRQWFWRETANTNYKTDKPRDILHWIAELCGGFITVNRAGKLELRQFCQPSLNIARIRDEDTEADTLEIDELYLYPKNVSLKTTFDWAGATTRDYTLTDPAADTDCSGFDIRIDENIIANGLAPHEGNKTLSLKSFICGIFQGFMRYEDIDYDWETKTPFLKDESVSEHIGLFKAYPVPFKCKVHKPERYELGQTVVFPDHPNEFNNYRYGTRTHVPYLRSVITSVEWTFRGGQALACGEGDTRSMMQLSQDSKSDAVLRELRNRV